MLEATIWEKVKQGASRRLWRSVAEDFYESAESEWPSSLCSFEHAQQIGVAVEIRALEERKFFFFARRETSTLLVSVTVVLLRTYTRHRKSTTDSKKWTQTVGSNILREETTRARTS